MDIIDELSEDSPQAPSTRPSSASSSNLQTSSGRSISENSKTRDEDLTSTVKPATGLNQFSFIDFLNDESEIVEGEQL